MALSAGTRVGAYEITGLLGAGGMGEVYRARDSRLKREVAIKVLPADVANDPERLARFQREAEVLASLNHAHIAHIYGLENPPGGGHHIVMELVEGEDLSQRITRGPIPIDEALPIARQIAEALEAAHDAGIIHRDLKPGNIKVRDDGTVKVLDFGLAKALDSGSGSRDPGSGKDPANSPTITSPAVTMRGVILGTAAYMSPEQARGKFVDRRTDIWAFGCVLYELLTGKRTFAGDDVSDTLVSILRDNPRWAALPPDTPPHVKQLLRRCLQRDPQKRLPHIGAARLELADADTGELLRATIPPSNRWQVPAMIGALIGAAIVAIAAFVMRPSPRTETDRPTVRFTIDAPNGMMFPGAGGVPRFAVSPDGRRIAYQLQDASSVRLFVRPLDAIDAEPAAGESQADATAGSVPGGSTQQPFWSPDGLTLAFFDDSTRQMKKHDLRTKLTDVITDVPGNQMSGTWSGDAILFSSLLTNGIRHVRPGGDGQRQITTVDAARHEAAHLWPDFLRDGRHFTYLVTFADGTPSAVFVSSIDGGSPRKLFDSPTGARFAWPDRLTFVRDQALVSQRFDLQTLSPSGPPDVIASNLLFTPAGRIGVSTATRANVIAYATGAGQTLGEGFETRWVDRAGSPVSGAPPSVISGINGVRLTADGRTLLYGRGILRNGADVATSLWAQDTQRGIETRLSDIGAPGTQAVASPDGTRMIHRVYDVARISLMMLPLSGATAAERLFSGEFGEAVVPFDWTARNEILFFVGARLGERTGLWLLPVGGDHRPAHILAGAYSLGASVSPDGRWIAYAAGGSIGAAQVFVQSFPDPALGKWPVSAIGAAFPRWRADGREIFYVDDRRRLMAASFAASPRVEIGKAALLFGEIGADRSATVAYPYDVMPDGKRFVVLRPRGSSQPTAQIVVDVQ